MNLIISISLLAMTAAFAIVFSQKTIDEDDDAEMLPDADAASQLKVLKRQMSGVSGRLQKQESQIQRQFSNVSGRLQEHESQTQRQMAVVLGRLSQQERQLQAIAQVQSTCPAACRPESGTMC